MTYLISTPALARAHSRALLRKFVRRLWRHRHLHQQRARSVFSAFSKKLERRIRQQMPQGISRYSRHEVQRRLRLVGGKER